MPLPVGVATATVTFGSPASTFFGGGVATRLTVEPTHALIHRATKAPLLNFIESAEAAEGMPGSITLPLTDQEGFSLASDPLVDFTGWAYKVKGSWSYGGSQISFEKNFQLVAGQTVVDLDEIPGGSITLPVSAPIATVTSVLGKTGAISAEDLGELGVADGSVDEVKLDPAVVTKIDGKLDAVDAADFITETQADASYAPQDDPRFDVIASGGAPVISTARDVNGRPYIRITQAAPAVPGKVTGVAVVPGNDTAAVSWTDLTGASGYDIEHVGSTGSAVIVQDSGSPLTLSGLPVGSRTVRVRAYNAGGAGEWSDPVTVTVGPVAPGKVTGVVVTPGNKTASVAYGTPSGTITTFRIREKLTSGSTWNEYTDAATPLVLTTSANGSHDFQVRAENGSAAGEWSDVVTVTLGAVNGVVASDNMNRSGDLVGSSPVVGPGPWSGTNAFTLDGTWAVSLGTGQLQYLPLAARGDVTIDANVRVGTQETATKAMRLYLKFPAATDTLYIEISCKGNQTSLVTLNKRIGNTITVLASFPTTTLPANTAPADYAVQISVVGLNVSGTVNGTTRSGTLLQSDADTLSASQQIAIYSTSTNHSVDSLSASVNGLYV